MDDDHLFVAAAASDLPRLLALNAGEHGRRLLGGQALTVEAGVADGLCQIPTAITTVLVGHQEEPFCEAANAVFSHVISLLWSRPGQPAGPFGGRRLSNGST